MKLEKSLGEPIFIVSTSNINLSFTSDQIVEGIYALDIAEHFCPWYSKAPLTIAVTKTSISQDL